MAAIAKHTYQETIGVSRHNERTLHHDAPNIDPERSHLNYNLAPDHGGLTDREYLDQRMSELWHIRRPDLNVTAEIVITKPQELPPEQTRAFFESCERFCEARYGRNNIISSWVHMDETTPHIHVMFVPEGANRRGACISYEQVFGRRSGEFNRFHPELNKWIHRDGFECDVNSGITKQNGRAFTVEELKNGTYERFMAAKHEMEHSVEFEF